MTELKGTFWPWRYALYWVPFWLLLLCHCCYVWFLFNPVSEMTYTVSSGTLNSSIPFCLTFILLRRLIQDRVRLPKASKGETLGLVRQLKVKWCVHDLCKYRSLANKPPLDVSLPNLAIDHTAWGHIRAIKICPLWGPNLCHACSESNGFQTRAFRVQTSAKAGVTLTATLTWHEPDHQQNLITSCQSHTASLPKISSKFSILISYPTSRQANRETDNRQVKHTLLGRGNKYTDNRSQKVKKFILELFQLSWMHVDVETQMNGNHPVYLSAAEGINTTEAMLSPDRVA